MKIYIQWAKRQAEDWQPLEVRNNNVIAALFKRGAPDAHSKVDDRAGWICGLNCQGIIFDGYDHIAVEVVRDGLRITGWMDDPEDHGDTRWATEWTLLEPAPDERLGGRMNTRQTRRIWGTADVRDWFPGEAVLPWEDFVRPPSNLTLHGIWMADELFERHRTTRTFRGWREWV